MQSFFGHDFGLVELSQVELGEVEHEKEMLESRKQTVHPHSTSNINIPEEHLSKIHTENAVLLHNCLFLRSNKTSIQDRIPRTSYLRIRYVSLMPSQKDLH